VKFPTYQRLKPESKNGARIRTIVAKEKEDLDSAVNHFTSNLKCQIHAIDFIVEKGTFYAFVVYDESLTI